MKVIFKSIFLCALGVTSSFSLGATVKDLEIKADGQTWTYHLHVPLQARSGGAPLVVVFHGAGGNGKDYLIKNGWVALSEKGRICRCGTRRATGLASFASQLSRESTPVE